MEAEATNHRLVKFIWAAGAFFAWSLIMGVILSAVGPVRDFVHMGWPSSMVSGVHMHIGLIGWMSLALMASFYYILPKVSGKAIAWPNLIEWVFWIFVICHAVSQILLMVAGIAGGKALAGGTSMATVSGIVSTFSLPGGIFCTLTAIAGLMFIVQVFVSLARGTK
jgi:cbb3-type cytochrome oxidase subunit 1